MKQDSENRFLWVHGEQSLRRGQFTIILWWVMNPHGFQPEHVIHLTSEQRKRPFPTTAWPDCANSYSGNWATLTCSTVTSCMEPIPTELVLILYITLFMTPVVIFKWKLSLSLQLSTFPARFWATSADANDITPVGTCRSIPSGGSGTASLNCIQVCDRQSRPFSNTSQRKMAYFIV